MASTPPPNDHPAWEVYDLLRDTRFNAAYYVEKLARAQRSQRWYEILLAVMAPGSAIAGFTVWKTDWGSVLWTVLASIVALLAVAKPFLKMSESVQTYESSATEYRSISSELDSLRSEIAQDRAYGAQHREWLRHIRLRVTRAADSEPIEPPDNSLRAQLYERISLEHPINKFYFPPEAT